MMMSAASRPAGTDRAGTRRAGNLPLGVRLAAVALLALYPLGAGTLLLTSDGWGVNRLNVRIWFAVTGALGVRGHVTPEQFATIANVLLFIPFFAALAVLLPRWWWIILGAAISSAVELYQLVIGSRDATFEDIAMNTLGAAIGTGAGILLRRLLARRVRGPSDLSDTSDPSLGPPGLSGRSAGSAPSDPSGSTTPDGSPAASGHAPDGGPDDRG
ncbi:VanZ family protein [Brachybacterium sp. DNPG3]